MVSNFNMPPAGFGPGSQPQDVEGDLEYMAMPQDMRTFSLHVPEVSDRTLFTAAFDIMERIAEAAARAAETGETAGFDLSDLRPADRQLVAETMGEGEVSMRIRGIPAVAVQESVFAGVWMLKGAGVDRIEVAACPTLVAERAFRVHRPAQGKGTPRAPGVVNAPSIAAELFDKSAARITGDPPHVVNLTLLPHTEEDLAWLDAALGEGSVTILSRGYGNCRITATAVDRLWRVQFFNSMDTLILDTFEVTEVPEVAIAAAEDLSDSARRIADALEAMA